MGKWLRRGLLGLLLLVLGYQLWIFAHVWWWVDHNPANSAFMDERLDILQQNNPDAELRHKWVPYAKISGNLKRALVAAEDARFLSHDGFDWEGIQYAAEKNLKKGRIVAGGSTISQQLAKNLFLSGSRTPWRKLEEAIITVMLEKMMPKRRILEIYMNVIEWGNGVFGAQAAAHYYYRTSAAALTPAQAAKLAAMVPNPRYYDTHRNARGLLHRAAIIQARMGSAVVPR
ncbi:monofunctional biosynthetic peptidoglycan transglycosylase [Sulfuriferula multivorans]|uniref:Biosynthetic peptidoglycan transglycosylase n=1 Tax=Sulfuriferula multivorans TaxID=1559896 RepID=A0A401JB19_9PROT|nr:monofunctional biosynthetic peptidoglycan transglycosylase [Sulfuriferula multivorans]GBL44868.1 monofunctional biosynthetic peptidoglycan transglycosylase [Sulfuriferula multivorans]